MSEKIKTSIYFKLSKTRMEIQKTKPKMTGKNNYSKYDYYKMSDILPIINKAEMNNGICSIFTMQDNIPKLTTYDVENPDNTIIISIPYAEAQMKNAPKVHNIAASCAYFHRYLLLLNYGISDNDFVDSEQHISSMLVSKIQIDNMMSLISKTAINKAGIIKYMKSKYNKDDFAKLNLEEYYNVWEKIEAQIPSEIENEIDNILDGNANNTKPGDQNESK